MEQTNEWVVIGISGVTCGGKTTLANRLVDILTPVYVFHQDKYFYPDDSPKHVRCAGLEHNNYDILSALDMEAMYKDIVSTLRGSDRSRLRSAGRGGGRRLAQRGKRFAVVEGFTVLNYKPISELCHFRYYFVLPFGECFARRAHRLYSPPDIDGYFDRCVWPEHVKYRAEIEKDKRVVLVDGTRHDALDMVLAELKARGARGTP